MSEWLFQDLPPGNNEAIKQALKDVNEGNEYVILTVAQNSPPRGDEKDKANYEIESFKAYAPIEKSAGAAPNLDAGNDIGGRVSFAFSRECNAIRWCERDISNIIFSQRNILARVVIRPQTLARAKAPPPPALTTVPGSIRRAITRRSSRL